MSTSEDETHLERPISYQHLQTKTNQEYRFMKVTEEKIVLFLVVGIAFCPFLSKNVPDLPTNF